MGKRPLRAWLPECRVLEGAQAPLRSPQSPWASLLSLLFPVSLDRGVLP